MTNVYEVKFEYKKTGNQEPSFLLNKGTSVAITEFYPTSV